MKHTCALLLVPLMPTLLMAQGWFLEGAQWHHGYAWGTAVGYVRTEVSGDTTVNGLSGRRLQRMRETYDLADQTYYTEPLSDLVCITTDGLVSVHVPSLAAFDTLYDMNAVPGDRWQLPYLPDDVQNCAPDSWLEVVATGSRFVDDVLLRWLAVDIHFHSADTTTFRDTIVERVGLTGMYFLPHDFCNSFIDGQEAGAFRCYNDEEVSYVANADQACGFSVGMDGSVNVQRIGIYPNPSTGLLSIRLPEGPKNAWVQLFNAQGQLAYERSISKGLPLDLSSLHPGIYHVQVHLGSDHISSERWVKE